MKVTAEQALAIREAYADKDRGAGMMVLAGRYGISDSTVHNILTGKHVLTRGMPNISGTRGTLGRSKWDEGVGANLTERQVALLTAAPRVSLAEHRRKSCPKCGARSGERCRDPRSTIYPRFLKTVHPERKL